MLANIIRRFPHWIAAGFDRGARLRSLLAFLGSARVFDDWVFFLGTELFVLCHASVRLELRLPPYFSLAVTEVEIRGHGPHRIVSLAFHITCALVLYKLIYDLLRLVTPADRPEYASGANATAWALNRGNRLRDSSGSLCTERLT